MRRRSKSSAPVGNLIPIFLHVVGHYPNGAIQFVCNDIVIRLNELELEYKSVGLIFYNAGNQ